MSDDTANPGAAPSAHETGPLGRDADGARLQVAIAGRYRVTKLIGRGPFASVFQGEDVERPAMVAIKLFHIDAARSPALARRLAEVVHTVATLRDDGVLAGPSLDLHASSAFLVMPLMRRGSLASLLEAEGSLPVDRVVEIVHTVAETLDRLHARGITHRGVTPENILFGDDGRPLLADCGITDTLREGGAAHGSQSARARAYAAPEQRRSLQVDGRADQYALAVTAYEMLTGRRRLEEEIVAGIHTLSPIEVRDDVPLRKGIPLHVNAALQKALSAGAANRFPTTTDFAEALAGHGSVPVQGLPTVRTEFRLNRRRRFVGAICAVLLLLAIAAAVDPRSIVSTRAAWRAVRARFPVAGPGAGVTIRARGDLPSQPPARPGAPSGVGGAVPAPGGAPPARAGANQPPRTRSTSMAGPPVPDTRPPRPIDIRLRPSPRMPAIPESASIPIPGRAAGRAALGAARSWLSRVLGGRPERSPAGKAYIHVSVDRGMALVTIDGIPRGTAPLTVTVRPGPHTVAVHGTADYATPSKGIDATVDDTVTASFRSDTGR